VTRADDDDDDDDDNDNNNNWTSFLYFIYLSRTTFQLQVNGTRSEME
jgi:hypothetical protein